MRVADFFCGAGGFSEGFRQAGFEVCFAVDKWRPAITTYRANKPLTNTIVDDVIRISKLPDNEFHQLVPDTEVIIGSPPCQAFSSSNKSGNGDKTLGIELLEAYLRIVARKKYKTNSILKYWVLENVPNIRNYIKEKYTSKDLGLPGEFVLNALSESSKIYNAKYFGAPTNRKRFLCGEFPAPTETHTDNNVTTLGTVLRSLGEPLAGDREFIADCNYKDLILPISDVTDHQYVYLLEPFEWKTAKRLKEDKGYMGKMSFPENTNKPARTVMATMSASSRESMILASNDKYRLPTVREVASMMSFPLDYRFYGASIGIKYTLVGNAVPPKLSYALAVAMKVANSENIPNCYPQIHHDNEIPFINLNYQNLPIKEEKTKKKSAIFRYHIPYLILDAYRVEFTNRHSDFKVSKITWDVELHYSQGRAKAKSYSFELEAIKCDSELKHSIEEFIYNMQIRVGTPMDLQLRYCMTYNDRRTNQLLGPLELLEEVRRFIDNNIADKFKKSYESIENVGDKVPTIICFGYYILQEIMKI
jgi:DNA (cytosine-5)-methyltransferase 1